MHENQESRRQIAFGSFIVDPLRRQLFRDGVEVPITPRAFDTLVVLMSGRGRVVEKAELMRALWPDTVVEEINLNVQISTLRKALGEQPNDHRYIVTVPRRGYAFVADVIDAPTEPVGDAPIKHSMLRTPLRHWGRPAIAAVMVVLLTLLATTALIRTSLSAASPAEQLSIAVLPFHTLDGSVDGGVAVGLTDALITRLATVENLSVRSMSSVLACAASTLDPIAAGRQLDVRTVLDGKIQIRDNRIRVTVQLLDVSDSSTIWTETFDEESTDGFAIQDVVAGRIGQQLSVRLASAESTPRGRRSISAEDYAAYLRGRQHWNRRTDHDLRIAVEYFRRATEVDETAALAWSGLADSYAMLSVHGGLPPDEAFAKARDAAERALAIDDQLSEAHAARGGVLMRYDRDFRGARDEFERAIELDPGNATAHHWYGELLMQAGESEGAIERLRHASQLDPLSLIVQSDLAWALYYARRYDEADEQARRVLWIDSSFRPARQCLALVLVQQGEHAKALEECAKADLSSSAIAGTALVGLNEMQRARTILQQLRWSYRRGNKGAYAAARMFASLGEPASAVRWLRHAVRAREGQVAYLAIDPSLDSLRSEPGFQRLLAELAT